MRRISESDLKQLVAPYSALLRGDPGDLTYFMALVAIAEFIGHGRAESFGKSWVLRNIIEDQPALARNYFRRERTDESHFFRRIDLAELLFNLQEIPGINRVLDDLHHASGDHAIESAIAELEAAKLLMLSGLTFRFVMPTGIKGKDFDVEIQFPGGTINCELKCKLESTDLNDRTIVGSLREASSQLPTGHTNVIFVKLPTPWAWEDRVGSTVMTAVRRFFGNSRRIAAIVFHWAVFIPLGDRRVRRATACELVPNDNFEHGEIMINELATRLSSLLTSDPNINPYSRNGKRIWIHLPDIANEML